MMKNRFKIDDDSNGHYKRAKALKAWYAIVDQRNSKDSKPVESIKPLTRKEIYSPWFFCSVFKFKLKTPTPITKTMPTYTRFEDLPAWQEAIRLAECCEDFTEAAKNSITWSKRDQIDRASLSVSNNIAEGFERGTTKELLAFLYIARGSAGEVRSMLCYFERRPKLRNFKSQISNLKSLAESCSRQIRAWADHLQNSDTQGQRHLNDKTKAVAKRKRGAEDFQKMLQEHLPEDHPLRKK